MAGSAEMCWKEVGSRGKGGNCPESMWIVLGRCGKKRSVPRVVETLEKV
jgi:hypothetical protein